jgi:N4-gp56 family major capsid protein
MSYDSSSTLGEFQNIEQLQRNYYKQKAEDRLFQNLVLYPLGKKEILPAQSGGMFVFNRWQNVVGTTAAINEDTVTGGQTTMTANTALITAQVYGQFVKITQLANMTSRRKVYEDASLILADAASDTVDLLCRTELNSAISTSITAAGGGWFIGSSGTATTASIATTDLMSPAVIRRVVAKLQAMRVRPYRDGQAYAGVFHPFVLFDLQSDTSVGGFLATAQYSQPDKIWNGEIGKLNGVRLLQSQNIVTTNVTSGVTAYNNFVMGEGAFATVSLEDSPIDIIINREGSAGSADPYGLISTVAYKLKGFGVKYLSGGSLADFNNAHRCLKVTVAVSFNG